MDYQIHLLESCLDYESETIGKERCVKISKVYNIIVLKLKLLLI